MKIKIILLAIIIIMLSYYFKPSNQSTKANLTKSTQNAQTQLVDFEKNQKRQDQLKKLQNPQLIENSLKQVGKLTTLEGQYTYTDTIENRGIFNITLRQIYINYLYKFGIGINLEDVKVVQIVSGNIVYLKIPKDKIQVEYIEKIENQSSITDGKKLILFNQFQPSEIQMIDANCLETVGNRIGGNQKYFNAAIDSLHNELNKFMIGLGYTQVIFV